MFTLEPELERVRGAIGDRLTDALIARERRDVFSIHPELRIASWGGVMLLATAAGIVLTNNLERIGPLALAGLIALAAGACYAWAAWRRDRASVVDDYVLLLGALLVSADLAFIEAQFGVLGSAWRQHFLIAAVLHGVTAYVFRSRMVLSLSIAALAAWLGVDRGGNPQDFAIPAFLSAALLLVWRALDRRFAPALEFTRVFEHFAANLALAGGLALTFQSSTRVLGALLTIAFAGAVIAWGFRARHEWFVLYAFLYGVIAADVLIIDAIDNETGALFVVVVSMIAAIVILFRIHAQFRKGRS